MVKSKSFIIVCLIFSLLLISQKKLETIEGKLELGMDNKVVIVADSESKSKISYYIDGDLTTELEQFVGSTISAKGYVKDNLKSRWNRDFTIIEYTITQPLEEKKTWYKFWTWLF